MPEPDNRPSLDTTNLNPYLVAVRYGSLAGLRLVLVYIFILIFLYFLILNSEHVFISFNCRLTQ